MRIRVALARFHRDDSGAVVLIIALLMMVMMGFLALGVDLGSLYFSQKTLQSRADLAAISAVSNLHAAPDTRARDTVELNGLDRDALTAISYSRYTRDPALLPDQRLADRQLDADDVNAVTVHLSEMTPLYFARSFLEQDSTRIGARATAARFDLASFSLGSRLLSLDGGVLNALLGEALGTTVSLDLLDYEALADAQIDLLTFSDALANRADLAVGDYTDILSSDVDLADVAGALLDSGAVAGSTSVLTTVLNSVGAGTLNTARLIAVDGDDVAAQLEDVLPETTVTALDLLMASVDIVNADRIIETDLNVTVPNVTSTKLELVVGERPGNSGWITLGERNVTVHTAQVRLRLLLDLSPGILSAVNGGLDIASVALPVYLEVAGATATLSELNCSATQPEDILVRFDTGIDPLNGATGTHVAELFLGDFPAPDFQDTTTALHPSTLSHAKLLGVKIRPLGLGVLDADVNIKAHAAVGTSQQAETVFRLDEAPATGMPGTTRTFGSGALLGSAVGTLASTADVEVKLAVLGINLGLVNTLLNSVQSIVLNQLQPILLAVLTPLDTVLDDVLGELGIAVGEADLTLNGVACGKLLLVR